MNNINDNQKRGRGRPKKIINIEPENIIEDENSISTKSDMEEDDNFLNELDNEHFNDESNVDDIFKDIKQQKKTKTKQLKSYYEDENTSLFDEKGTELLGSERRILLSKIQQYKNLFPDELKNFKIKKNCSTQDLTLYLEEMETIVNCGSVEQFLTDSIIQCIKLSEGISTYTRHDITG